MDIFLNSFSNGASTEICFVIFCYVHIVDHLCRCEKWNRKSFKVHDADFGRSVCHYCDLFGDKTRSYGRSEIFPRAESEELSWMTVVAAMGQMFYSLSIAMGILITFGSYMKKTVPLKILQEM